MIELTLDSTATTELVVAASDLASALPLDSRDAFPAVFATARMVALMEIASARLLQPVLAPGQLSVGVSVEVIHRLRRLPVPRSPLPLAISDATASSSLSRSLLPTAGEVGRATHKRAIVDVERLQCSTSRRIAAATHSQ